MFIFSYLISYVIIYLYRCRTLQNLNLLPLTSRKNYLSWTLDAEVHLEAKNLGDTIKNGNQASP